MKVPAWLWLLIAVGNCMKIGDLLLDRLPAFDRMIQRCGNDPRLAALKADYESFRTDSMRDLVIALAVGPVASLFAYWKWSSTRPWARRFSFSLRTLLIVMTAVAVGLWFILWTVKR
jgi:hypothetical protein